MSASEWHSTPVRLARQGPAPRVASRPALGPVRSGYISPIHSGVLNIHARASISKALVPMGTALARLGVTPNVVTVVGTVGTVASALICFPNGWWFLGALLVWFFVMLDMVDGAVARAGNLTSPFGGVLDSTSDPAADAAVFGGIGWYFAVHGQHALFLGCLLCLVLGSITSYIRSRAEAAGLNATVGIAERAERLIIILVGTGLTGDPFGVPYAQAVAIWLLVAASAITVGQRLATVAKQSKELTRQSEPAGNT